MESTRPKFVKDVGRVDEATGFNIGIRFAKGLMKRAAVSLV